MCVDTIHHPKWQALIWSDTGRGYSRNSWVAVCSSHPKILTPKTKLCDFSYTIYDKDFDIYTLFKTWGPFLESRGNFSGPESYSKISNLTITKLFYSRILNMKRSSLHTRSFRCILFSVFGYRWTKILFTGPKGFRGFRETAPWPLNQYPVSDLLSY